MAFSILEMDFRHHKCRITGQCNLSDCGGENFCLVSAGAHCSMFAGSEAVSSESRRIIGWSTNSDINDLAERKPPTALLLM